MPNYKGHLAGGIVLYAAILVFFMPAVKSGTVLEWLFFVCIGALFPDIDTKSKGQRFFFALLVCVFVYLLLQQKVYAAVLLAIAACMPLIAHHRGLFHNFLFLTGFCWSIGLTVAYLLPDYRTIILYDTLFFWIGIFSHLLLDRGIKRLW